MITFVHIRDANNAGDMASCPADYLDFGPDVRVQNYSDPVAATDMVVYGGGTMVNWLNGRRDLPACRKAIWGAGSSRHGEIEPWPDPPGFDLVGTREWSPDREAAGKWAPCVSCLSPLFDREYAVTRAAVAFVNASASIRARYPAAYGTGLPTLDNTAGMADIVAFLGSARRVTTNSYHGALWAGWLGREVEILGYSSKFVGIEPSLARARAATRRFHDRVLALARAQAA